MKLLCSAFEATLAEFEITGQALSDQSGVATGAISHFKNDVHAITTDSLEKLLSALSNEALLYWLSQIAAARGCDEITASPLRIQTFVNRLDGVAASEVLTALAARLRDKASKKKTEASMTP